MLDGFREYLEFRRKRRGPRREHRRGAKLNRNLSDAVDMAISDQILRAGPISGRTRHRPKRPG
jgi:hypothetical protein